MDNDMDTKITNIVAILNPISGTKDKSRVINKLNSAFGSQRYRYSLLKTEYAGHAKLLSEKVVRSGADIAIAVGGDGTINEVASSLVGTNTALGIIALGSGNGFARHLGVFGTPEFAIDIIKRQRISTIDTCTVNGMPYINLAGIGVDAEVAYMTKKNTSRGLAPYILATLKTALKPTYINAELCTSDQCYKDAYLSVVVANGPLYGFNFSIAPNASLTDGNLDIMLIKKVNLFRYIRAIPLFMTGRLHNAQFIEHLKCKRLTVTTDLPAYYHVDGEGYSNTNSKFEFEVIPNSLKVIIPPDKRREKL